MGVTTATEALQMGVPSVPQYSSRTLREVLRACAGHFVKNL